MADQISLDKGRLKFLKNLISKVVEIKVVGLNSYTFFKFDYWESG